ncbi:unnamed protein product [Amaranthus hypochondriacus]
MEVGNVAPLRYGASTSQRKYTQLLCVILIVILLLALLVIAITVLIAFKYADTPQFHVKTIEVSAFTVKSINPSILSTNIDVFFNTYNKNMLLGLDLWNVVMETTWYENEMGARLRGTQKLHHFTQGYKTISFLRMNAKAEFQITNTTDNNIKKDDMKLDLILRGELNYYSGILWSVRRRFMVLCNGVSILSSNATCKTKLFYSNNI